MTTTEKPMMLCGHAANATNGEGKPSCAICAGIHAGADMVAETPNLEGRLAKCGCGRTEPSSTKLAFFEYCGPGSREATETCKCGYAFAPHTAEGMARNVASNRKTVIEDGRCKIGAFVARGPLEFDRYYCGHSGWD